MKPFSKRTAAEIYLEYVNDWITISAMAENYGRSEEEINNIIDNGRIQHEKNVKMGNSLKVAKDDQKKVIIECIGDYWYLYDEGGISIIGTEEGFNTEEEANDYANDNDLTIVTSFNLG